MSHELRQDPTTSRWVIVAPARGRRPGAEAPAAGGDPAAAGPVRVPTCPFCPGNEEKTPPELERLPAATGGWRVRVVPNLFPAVAPINSAAAAGALPAAAARTPDSSSAPSSPVPGAAARPALFGMRPAVGRHEVIIETPHHSRHLADMEEDELAAVLGVYRARYNALLAHPGIGYVSLFRNHGRDAGTSQAHPHAQLIAVPLVPSDVQRRWKLAARYRAGIGRCLYCDLLTAEREDGARWVMENGLFAAVCAYAPRFPYETWILPKRHQADVADLTDAELPELAQVLRAVLRALRHVLGDPPHNLVFHGKPGGGDGFHWHLQILPRTTRQAGFELGTEMAVVPVAPEQAAADLRAAIGA